MMGTVTSANTPHDDTAARTRLAELVKNRRLELRTSVRAAATTAGIARDTWTGLEEATRRTAETNYAGIEHALQWAPGSVAAILDGGEPAITNTSPARPATVTATTNIPKPTTAGPAFRDTLTQVMQRPDVPEAVKRRIVALLISEQEQFERAREAELAQFEASRAERAEQLLHILGDEQP
jgi:hypothetical protein